VSSLGGKDLTQYKSSKQVRALHLPIHPSPPHPDTNELLFLHGDLQLSKNSYIKTRTRYWVPLSHVRLDYRNIKSGQRFRLRADSLAKVRKAVDLSIPVKNGMTLATVSATTSRKPLARTQTSRSGWKSWLLSHILTLLIRLIVAFLVFWSLDWLIGDHLLARMATHLICSLLQQKCAWAHGVICPQSNSVHHTLH